MGVLGFPLDLLPTFAFLDFPCVDGDRRDFSGFFGLAFDRVVVGFFLERDWALAFNLGLALAAICHPPGCVID